MPLRTFWATTAAQMRSASCSAVCSLAMSSAVRLRGAFLRGDFLRGDFLRSLPGTMPRSSGVTSGLGKSTIFFKSSLIALPRHGGCERPIAAGRISAMMGIASVFSYSPLARRSSLPASMVTAIGAGGVSGTHFKLLGFLRARSAALASRSAAFICEVVIDLVLEPRDRVLADIDVQREFSGRLKPGDMCRGPGDAALLEAFDNRGVVGRPFCWLFLGVLSCYESSP